VTDGIESTLQKAREAAGGKDIRVGGGVSTVQQYLSARLIDEMHLAMSPVLLGAGENFFACLNLRALGYACTDRVATASTTHLIVTKQICPEDAEV
jgi:dihydrofolate reductase